MAEDAATTYEGFLVESPNFTGRLGELAYALRSGALEPQDIDVLKLVKDYLAYFEKIAAKSLSLASEALPAVARIVELKVRFLLPKPPKEEEEEDALFEDTLEAVLLLEELDHAIDFLRARRSERRIVLPAKMPKPDYPRAERPIKVAVSQLATMASRFTRSNYFELAVERFSMAQAMKHLMRGLKRLRRAFLRDLAPSPSWSNMTVTFAGMLELVKEGHIRAEQSEAYGPIEIEQVEAQQVRDVA